MKQKKKPLQTYLLEAERSDYIKVCGKLGISASEDIRNHVNKQIKKHKDSLK